MRRPLLAAGVASLAAGAVLAAQQPPSFHAETRLVVLQATVRTDRGVPVTNLDRGAFTVYENGRRQPIALFRRDDIPVSLGLLIDNSGSMRALRGRVEAAALAFVRASNPLDEVFVLNFADKPRIDVPLTNDIRRLEAGIARVDSIGGTALRDAVDAALTHLRDHAVHDRRVLLVITDGRDNASTATLRDIQRASEQTDTAVYAVGVFRDPGSATAKEGRGELDQLTEHTGGGAYYPKSEDALDAIVGELARQIRHQYTIAYAPTNQALDGTYRRIRLEARGPEPLVVRTRAGYVAARGTPPGR
jgi:Ca-activated chloride channel family protein